jgi:hypothetical protein
MTHNVIRAAIRMAFEFDELTGERHQVIFQELEKMQSELHIQS